MAALGLVEFHIVVLEGHACGQIDLDSRCGISGLGGHLVASRGRQITLVLNHLENGGSP